MAINGSSQLNAIVKLFANSALEPLRKTLQLGSIVNRAYDDNQKGDTVNVGIPASASVNQLTEGSAVSYVQSAMTNVAIPVNRHFESSFQITDLATMLGAYDDLVSIYLAPCVQACAEQVESDLFSNYTSFSGSVGTQGTALTSAVIDSAETLLFTNKVPTTTPLYLALTPTDYGVVRQIPEFVNQYQVGTDQAALSTGVLGTIKGFNVFRSQLVPTVAVGSPATVTRYNMAFAPDSLALVTRKFSPVSTGTGAVSAEVDLGGFRMRIVYSYDPTTLSDRVTCHILYGTASLRPSFGVKIVA